MTTSPSCPPGPGATILPPMAPGQIEIWKKIVDVQQHFNDLELRIRNFALVVTGAFLGLGGYAIKDGGVIALFGHEISIAGLVVFSATLPLFAFYFMDRLWYHRLLDGSVQAGIDAENALRALGYTVDLGSRILEASPFKLWLTGRCVHSKTKMDIFYGMLLLTLLAVAASLGFVVRPQRTTPPNPASFAMRSTESGTPPAPRQEKPLPPGPIWRPALPNSRTQTAPPSAP